MEYRISSGEMAYFGIWLFLLIIATTLIARRSSRYEFLTFQYIKFLLEPWKIGTFLAATAMITLAAPISGDHTWDIPDSLLISIITFYFCPWSIATIYKYWKKTADFSKLFVAFCLFWLPCWAYDAYIFFRDKRYPSTWWTNLIISGGICFAAGLFWNLAWTKKDGAHFAFYSQSWPTVAKTPFIKVLAYSIILMAPVVIAVGWFVWKHLSSL